MGFNLFMWLAGGKPEQPRAVKTEKNGVIGLNINLLNESGGFLQVVNPVTFRVLPDGISHDLIEIIIDGGNPNYPIRIAKYPEMGVFLQALRNGELPGGVGIIPPDSAIGCCPKDIVAVKQQPVHLVGRKLQPGFHGIMDIVQVLGRSKGPCSQ
jgi:hypothetical protein